jgi:hypothetical protein
VTYFAKVVDFVEYRKLFGSAKTGKWQPGKKQNGKMFYHFAILLFYICFVAGTGFEPMTFGL